MNTLNKNSQSVETSRLRLTPAQGTRAGAVRGLSQSLSLPHFVPVKTKVSPALQAPGGFCSSKSWRIILKVLGGIQSFYLKPAALLNIPLVLLDYLML